MELNRVGILQTEYQYSIGCNRIKQDVRIYRQGIRIQYGAVELNRVSESVGRLPEFNTESKRVSEIYWQGTRIQ